MSKKKKKKLGNRMADRYWGAEKMFICGVISVVENIGEEGRGEGKKIDIEIDAQFVRITNRINIDSTSDGLRFSLVKLCSIIWTDRVTRKWL